MHNKISYQRQIMNLVHMWISPSYIFWLYTKNIIITYKLPVYLYDRMKTCFHEVLPSIKHSGCNNLKRCISNCNLYKYNIIWRRSDSWFALLNLGLPMKSLTLIMHGTPQVVNSKTQLQPVCCSTIHHRWRVTRNR